MHETLTETRQAFEEFGECSDGAGIWGGNAWNECGIPSPKNNGNAETNVATNPEKMRNTHAGKHAGHECAHKRRCKWSGTWARRQTRKRNKTNHACALQGRPDFARCTQHNKMTTTCRRRDQTQKIPQRTETTKKHTKSNRNVRQTRAQPDGLDLQGTKRNQM